MVKIDALRNAIGIFDRKAAVLNYTEVEGGRVLRMEPRARGLDYGPTAGGGNVEIDRALRLANNKRWSSTLQSPHDSPNKSH